MKNNFSMTNNAYECIMLLKNINDLIHTLYKLSEDYYIDYIFNQSATVKEEIKNMGMNEEYFLKLVGKFEKLRALIYGDQLDWDELANYEIFKIAEAQNNEINSQDDYIKKLEYEKRKDNSNE